MKRKILTWLFKNNEPFFAELMVKNFYSEIPTNIREPSVDFLINGRGPLERFFTLQAYYVQRRAMGDMKNLQHYTGILFYIKSLLAIIQKSKPIVDEVMVKEKEKDPLEGVQDFIKGYEEKKI